MTLVDDGFLDMKFGATNTNGTGNRNRNRKQQTLCKEICAREKVIRMSIGSLQKTLSHVNTTVDDARHKTLVFVIIPCT
jgi:hypothetical protein